MKKKSKDMKREYAPYKEISGEVADRIIALREEHGYKTQPSFADVLEEASPYEVVGFKLDNIKKRDAHNVPYKIEELIEICELFNVDLDYLLGRQKEKRHEIKQLKELTGLSEETCERLEDYLKEEREETALQWFIENGFLEAISRMESDARLINQLGEAGYNKITQLGDFSELIVQGVAERRTAWVKSICYAYYDKQHEQLVTRRNQVNALQRKYLQETLKKMSETELREIMLLEKDESEEDDGQENT